MERLLPYFSFIYNHVLLLHHVYKKWIDSHPRLLKEGEFLETLLPFIQSLALEMIEIYGKDGSQKILPILIPQKDQTVVLTKKGN